jgi:hypothetical protein
MEGTNICLAMHIKKLKVAAYVAYTLCVVTYRVPAQADKKGVVQHIFFRGWVLWWCRRYCSQANAKEYAG